MGAKVSYFNYEKHVKELQAADVLISPKILENAYEMGHTEYKIMTGMACGLPVIASPQPSYREALSCEDLRFKGAQPCGGGFLCDDVKQWEAILNTCIEEAAERCDKKQLPNSCWYTRLAEQQARRNAVENYSIPVIAKKYRDAILECLA